MWQAVSVPVHATVIMMGLTGLSFMFKEFQGGLILFGNFPGTLSHHLLRIPGIQTSFRDHLQANFPAAYFMHLTLMFFF